MIVNVRNGKDLVTVDLRVRQIRYVHAGGRIEFIPLSSSDVDGYEYLFENDKRLFLKSLREDLVNNLGLNSKGLKIVGRK